MNYQKKNSKPVALVILDGFGYRLEKNGNALAHAVMPTYQFLLENYPHFLLQASGDAVGLPDLVVGNSEAGHLTLGSGRIIEQPSLRINKALETGTFFKNPVLLNNLNVLKKKGGKLHCMGLLSNGNVHSTLKHLYAYLEAAHDQGCNDIFIHAFLDGRDVAPGSAGHILEQVQEKIEKNKWATIGSLQGRFYAMDRDNNWQRTYQAYKVLTQKQEMQFSWRSALNFYTQEGLTEEFIPPTQLNSQAIIQNGDGIIFFNYRPDRARQLTRAFVDPHFDKFEVQKIALSFFITPVSYFEQSLTSVLFENQEINNTLTECLSAAGKTVFAVAETEKYAHITYFFNGGKEKIWPGQTRVLIPSLLLKNYVQHPEMSAKKITQALINSLEHNPFDFYLINYANADMVGHSGDFNATVKALECLDKQLRILYESIVKKYAGILCIVGDHGKAEEMIDLLHHPNTAHTNNPVPFIIVSNDEKPISLNLKTLADVAPVILDLMNVPIPSEMKKKKQD